MQCHNCNHTIATWHSYCPHCQQRVQPISYSTISDAPTETLEEHSRRKLLRKILQFALFAVAIIAVASAIRLSPSKATPPIIETAKPQPSFTPTVATETTMPPVVSQTPDLAIAMTPSPTPEPASKIAGSDSQTINIFSQADLARISQTEPSIRTSAQPVQRIAAPTVANVSFPTVKKAKIVDEALPKNLVKITKETSAPPAPVAAPVVVEPSLELDSGSVALNPNTGLLSIKSYVPARVYIDGIFSGVTPRSVKLLAGEHVITLMADGYQEYARKVKVNGQQQMGILASMSKK